jgi:hypothetical protein
MIVSNFYLRYAPGSNPNPVYTSGYELEVTNLSDKQIQFEVVAQVTRYGFRAYNPPETPATVLANLKELIPGVIKNDTYSWFTGGWSHDADGYALHITFPIAPHTSELFDITPSQFQSRYWFPRVAGHIELTVPAVRSDEPPYDWVPQATDPVPVLLNPSTVETWQVHTGVPGGGGAFGDSRTSPPLATGQAYNEITPDTRPRLLRISVRDYLETVRSLGAAGLAQSAVGLSPEDRAQVLIDLLDAIGDDEAEQAALNEVLEGLGSSTRVVRTTGQD